MKRTKGRDFSILGLTGRKRCGKDTIALKLLEVAECRTKILSLAAPLKGTILKFLMSRQAKKDFTTRIRKESIGDEVSFRNMSEMQCLEHLRDINEGIGDFAHLREEKIFEQQSWLSRIVFKLIGVEDNTFSTLHKAVKTLVHEELHPELVLGESHLTQYEDFIEGEVILVVENWLETSTYEKGKSGGYSIRDLQVCLGTVMREIKGSDYWVDTLMKQIEATAEAYDLFVIKDVRMDNEAKWINALGGEVHSISRESENTLNDDSPHLTERGILPSLITHAWVNKNGLETTTNLASEIHKSFKGFDHL